ncbi:MAG: SDR family NAD(P)-dependent oxidoreductase [Halieaceae bacterium]|nr:SDR family NAD(P)-dependent oxidoreductase [Halieaceae bacterium]
MATDTRTALITGATAGLGKEFARQLAGKGYNLVLVARNQEALASTAESLAGEFGVDAQWIAANLSDPAAPRALYDEAQARGIQVDYLVNNAGIAGPNLLEDTDWAEQQAFFQLMMLSIAELCHLFIPSMQERGFGRVINVASVAGRISRAGGCNYGPSKAWVIALSEELALTVGKDGVNVSALCPGYTHTEFHERAGLMDMKNSMPGWMWYDAETVVRDGIAAAERGKRVYASGRLYRLLDPFFQSVWTRRLFSVSDGR